MVCFYTNFIEPKKEKPGHGGIVEVKELNFPDVYLVYKNLENLTSEEKKSCFSWDDKGYNWDEKHIFNIILGKEGNDNIHAVAINMDCNILRNFIKNQKIKTKKDIEFAKICWRTIIFFLVVFSFLSNRKRKDRDDILQENIKYLSYIFLTILFNKVSI